MSGSPLENVSKVFVFTSPTVLSMSCPSHFGDLCDRRYVAVQLLFLECLCGACIVFLSKHFVKIWFGLVWLRLFSFGYVWFGLMAYKLLFVI